MATNGVFVFSMNAERNDLLLLRQFFIKIEKRKLLETILWLKFLLLENEIIKIIWDIQHPITQSIQFYCFDKILPKTLNYVLHESNIVGILMQISEAWYVLARVESIVEKVHSK